MVFGPKELRKSGEALFGPRWQTDIARALDVNSRRVRQWIKGERPLPGTIDKEIKKLLEDRKLKIENVLNTIKNFE